MLILNKMQKEHRNLLYIIIALLVLLNAYQRHQNNLTEKVAINLLNALNDEEEKSLNLFKEKTTLDYNLLQHQKKCVNEHY